MCLIASSKNVGDETVKKYIVNIEAHVVGYLYIMDLINARKTEHI